MSLTQLISVCIGWPAPKFPSRAPSTPLHWLLPVRNIVLVQDTGNQSSEQTTTVLELLHAALGKEENIEMLHMDCKHRVTATHFIRFFRRSRQQVWISNGRLQELHLVISDLSVCNLHQLATLVNKSKCMTDLHLIDTRVPDWPVDPAVLIDLVELVAQKEEYWDVFRGIRELELSASLDNVSGRWLARPAKITSLGLEYLTLNVWCTLGPHTFDPLSLDILAGDLVELVGRSCIIAVEYWESQAGEKDESSTDKSAFPEAWVFLEGAIAACRART